MGTGLLWVLGTRAHTFSLSRLICVFTIHIFEASTPGNLELAAIACFLFQRTPLLNESLRGPLERTRDPA